ncbi:MAG: InlB B-repeat-containing protein [Clostridiales bacterium]|nr:InlB B-repeat-containing protein [Clostridiales bacterium]
MMTRKKKIMIAAIASCSAVVIVVAILLGVLLGGASTYAVTYAFGSCGDTAYAGTSTLPTEAEKEEDEKFTLAVAPVWDGYTFLGWNDGEKAYSAGAEYTMPAHAVTLTATWQKISKPTYK